MKNKVVLLGVFVAWASLLRGAELWNWGEMLQGERFDVNPSAGVSITQVEASDIGRLVVARNTSGVDKSFSIGTSFDVPYVPDCELSYWFGVQGGGSRNFSSVTLEGRAVFPGTQRWLYRLTVRAVRGSDEGAVCATLADGGTYSIETTTSTNANCKAFVSVQCYVDDTQMIDGVRFFHYRLKLSGLLEAPRTVLYLGGINYVGLPAQAALMLGGVSLTAQDDSIHEDRSLYSNSYDLPNRIRDSFDDKAADLLMKTSFTVARNNLSHQPYFETQYQKQSINKVIQDPRSGVRLEMSGFRLQLADGSPLPHYVDSKNLNPIFKVVNTYYATESYRYEVDRNYALQFWFDASELAGNSLTRIPGYNPLRVNTSNEPIGRKFMFSADDDYMAYTQRETLLQIVDRVGDLVCLRAYATTNTANRGSFDFTFSIYSCSGRPVTQVSIYNLTLIESPYIDPYHDYPSESERNGSPLRGKRILYVGDSQYNNGILGTALEQTLGCFSYDMHYGGHRIAIPANYSTATGVNGISHSWFYQENYRMAVLTQPEPDVVILTMSTNDGGGDPNWSGEIDEDRIAAVKAAYPTYSDLMDSDASKRDGKRQRFDEMSDAERKLLFSFVPTYCAYIEQIREAYPNVKLYLCTVPISCSGMLTGSAVPDPADVDQSIGEWKSGYDRFVARQQLEPGANRIDEQIRAIAKRYNIELIDLKTESELTYDNFIYFCSDGTHWSKKIAHRCAQSIMRALRGYGHEMESGRSAVQDYDVDGVGTFSFSTTLGEFYTGADYLSVLLDGRMLCRVNFSSTNWMSCAFSTSDQGPHRFSLHTELGPGSVARQIKVSKPAWSPVKYEPEVVYSWSCITNADGYLTVTGVMPAPKYEIVLPTQLLGRPVSKYSNGSFWGNSLMTRVTIPEGVVIDPLCFRDCASALLCVDKGYGALPANGLPVRILSGGHDITDALEMPLPVNGVVDVAAARVRQEVADDALDFTRMTAPAEFHAERECPIKTAPTVPGLTYVLLEGSEPSALVAGDQTIGDGKPWEPEVKVSGSRAFFRIRVEK